LLQFHYYLWISFSVFPNFLPLFHGLWPQYMHSHRYQLLSTLLWFYENLLHLSLVGKYCPLLSLYVLTHTVMAVQIQWLAQSTGPKSVGITEDGDRFESLKCCAYNLIRTMDNAQEVCYFNKCCAFT
jgi:hypothetical protein